MNAETMTAEATSLTSRTAETLGPRVGEEVLREEREDDEDGRPPPDEDATDETCILRPVGSCTYSPDSNRLMFAAGGTRLPPDLYERVKAAGFRWAPHQKVFIAARWTPEAEDLMIELAHDIEDDDASLVERAEERAERFEEYREHRAADAESAHRAVAAIADNIPLGQPILIGHHSEKRARRDAERIRSGMTKAVKMWETANYWKGRAAGAIGHAKYLERPDVRFRRIKTLETDRRRWQKRIDEVTKFSRLWEKVLAIVEGGDVLRLLAAKKIANCDSISLPKREGENWRETLYGALEKGTLVPEDAARIAIETHERTTAYAQRWLTHLDNRVVYEKAMLGEVGGVVSDKFKIEVGGKVLTKSWRVSFRSEWLPVLRVNRGSVGIQSVSTRAGAIPIEEVLDYTAPEAGDVEKAKAVAKLAPMVNHPCEGHVAMTKAEWAKTYKDYKSSRTVKASETMSAYRYRTVVRGGALVPVFLTDSKRIDPPAGAPSKPALARFRADEVKDASDEVFEREVVAPAPRPRPRPEPEPTVFDAMKASLKASLKAGIHVVSAPQLFPTPDALADRLVAAADIRPGHRVLEPSAGTGQIVRAILRRFAGEPFAGVHVTAIEINPSVCAALEARHPMQMPEASCEVTTLCGDFLTMPSFQPADAEATGFLPYDRILLNPPFADHADIAHVARALALLAPGGRLVAIMSGGIEFRTDTKTTAFRELIAACGGTIERLPDDSFAASGTSVRTVLVTYTRLA